METKIQRQIDEKLEKDIEEKKKEAMKNSLKEAVFVSGTVGFGDSYIPAYGIALGASPKEIGFLTSLPNIFGALSQIFTSRVMEKIPRKKILSISILFQSLLWLPIILLPLFLMKEIKYSPLLLIVFYTSYVISGNFANPAWLSWMGDLVPKKEIGRFFGRRNSLGSISVLLTMIIGGLILDLFKKRPLGNEEISLFLGFALCFFLAMIFRLFSRHFVLLQYEPEFRFQKINYFSFFQFLKAAPKRNFGRFAIFLALILLATNIVVPFYTIYMIRDLKFSYLQFMLIQVSVVMATFLFMPLWGKFVDEYGNINTLRISSLMVPLVCFLWPISIFLDPSTRFFFLVAINFFAGFSWAGFNLAVGNFLYDATTPEKRSLCGAYSSILNSFGIFIGTTLGSLLISHLKISFINIIMFVSVISGIARYFIIFLVLPRVAEVRVIETRPTWKAIPLFSQILALPIYFQNITSVKTIKIPIWKIARKINNLNRFK